MRKKLCMLLALVMLLGISTIGVCARTTVTTTLGAGFYKETMQDTASGLTVTHVTDSSVKAIEKGGKDYFYFESEKLEVSCAATKGKQYLVMLVTGTFETAPTSTNEILYINQITATGTTVSFSGDDCVYPNLEDVAADTELTLLITSDGGNAMKKTTFYYGKGSYEVISYMLGDVNEDGKVNSSDASWVLQSEAQLRTLTVSQQLAGNVTSGDTKVNSSDASYILQFEAQLIKKFPIEN